MAENNSPDVNGDVKANDQNEDGGYSVQVQVNRPVYTQQDFNQKYNESSAGESTSVFDDLRHRVRGLCSSPSAECAQKTVVSLFPCVQIMREYSVRNDLLNDVMAGLIVGVMHIPQGMAYGMLSKLDPVFGLYTSFFPVICYFFFGTSKHISIGTFAVVSLMVGKVVEQSDCGEFLSERSSNDSMEYGNFSTTFEEQSAEVKKCQIGVAMAVSFVVGVIQILLGVFRFGFVTIYLSDPLTRALTMSAAIHVATSQIRHMFGISMGRFSSPFKLIYMYITLFKNIVHTNVASLITCLIAMVIIYAVQRWVSPRVKAKFRVPVPIELIVIIFSTLISYFAKLSERFNVSIVGEIPTGIPPPSFPPVQRFPSVFGDAVGIAIVSFTINISMGKLFAKKHSYQLDSNQELLAYGFANVSGSMLNSFVSTASLSRSAVQNAAGGKTQVAGLVSSCLLLIVLLAIAPLFYSLPTSILAAIILVNLKGVLMQITDIKTLYKSGQYFDMLIWIVTALAVILTDVDTGLYAGVAFSLLTIVFRTQSPQTSLLGRIPHTDFYEDVNDYSLAQEIPGVKVFRFKSSLYYANAEHFAQKLYKKTGCNPGVIKRLRARQKRDVAEAERTRLAKEKKQQKTIDVENNKSNAKEIASEKKLLTQEASDLLASSVLVNRVASDENKNVLDEVPPAVQNIILDFSSLMFIDTVGITSLKMVLQDYKEVGVRVFISCCHESVYEKLEKSGIFKKFENCTVFVGVHDAVLAAVDSSPALQQQLKVNKSGVLGSVMDAYFTSDPDANNE